MTQASNDTPASRTRSFITLALILIILAPPLFINVGRPAPTRIMETLSFLTSQETWLRMRNEDPNAWKMPSWNGLPRIQKPPLLVWLNMLAWRGLDARTATVEDLVLRSRVLAVCIALLAVIAIYWAGITLGGIRLGCIAALATGSGMFFIRQARYASYDTHIMGWATLAVAAGLWTMRALDHQKTRRIAGWLICLFALAATNYTKGPLGFALVIPPLAVVVWAFTDSRRRNTWELAAVTGLSILTLVPWFVLIHRLVPDATRLLDAEYRYIFELSRNPFFYLIIFGVVFPWIPWFVHGAALPFTDKKNRADRGMLFTWGWLVILLIVLSLSPVKNKRYIVPALPPAGLLIAYAWLAVEKAIRGEKAGRWIAAVRAIHWGVLGLGSFLLPVFVATQPLLLRVGLIRRPDIVGLPRAACVIVLFLLVGLWHIGFRADRRARMGRAALFTALWMTVASAFGYYGYALAPRQQFAQRMEAETFALFVRETPVYYISRFQHPYHEAAPGHEFLIYYRGVVPEISTDEIKKRIEANDRFLLMTRLTPEDESALDILGLHQLFGLSDGREPSWKVWAHGERDL